MDSWLGALALAIFVAVIVGSGLLSGEKGKNRTCSDCGYRPTNDGSSVCERCMADDWA
ncbi:hypothetical protein [Sphingomonas azotifigens]|uniref:hypothetical protein n=1 Tax=Sphingomonas azotifigens TaxID=330920 RepID=UPI0014321F91|nr:hypothetical protein [Sphingomonas azotifigens]